MTTSVTCSSCGGTEDLAVVQAGGGRFFEGALRVLIYCEPNCRAHPERCAPWREAVMLAEVTEDLLLDWYREGKTVSAPDIVSELVWGEPHPAWIIEAEKVIAARQNEETS